ncbi:hypothetical protein [Streptomyces sp. NPDC051098]|uniref:hypothetical protein n=1 Tax=Streptomyces sp. NPDC051098 TaxID=3155411 RepID=UPI0034415056
MAVNRPVPSVTVVAVAADAATEQSLRKFLADAGISLTDQAAAEAVVVLISEAAVDDPQWLEKVDQQRGVRLVPMRIDGVASKRAPEHLRPVNWVSLQPNSHVTAFGTVLAAVLSDPEQVRALRNLRAEAEAWVRGNQSPDRLIGDHRRAADARELLNALRGDDYIDTRGPVGDFVETSYRSTQKARTWQRRRRAAGTVLVAVMALIVAVSLPRLLKAKGTDFNALVSFGDPASAREMPEWSSLQAAQLLLRGNADQKALARQALSSLLSVPWSLGGPMLALDEGDPTGFAGLALLPDDRQAAVLIHDASDDTYSIGLYDIREGRMLWRVHLGAGYADIATAAHGRTVVAVGKEGTAVVELSSRKVRRLGHSESGEAHLRLTRNDVMVVGRKDRLAVGSPDDKDFRTVGDRYEELLSLEATADGGARALVAVAPGRYRLLDALTGKVLARADVDAPLIAAGAVGTDRVYAVYAGADRQLWEMGPGRPPAPTGVATPERTGSISLLDGGRAVVGGQDQRARAVRLEDGGELGVVCRDVPRLYRLVLPPSGDVVGCYGHHNTTLWRVPEGPRAAGAAGSLHTGGRTENADLGVQVDGGYAVVDSPSRKAFRVRLFASDITASRLSEDGSQLVAAARSGDVAVVSLRMSDGVPRVVARWRIPGGGPAAAVGWDGGDPLVRGPAGAVWTVPGCSGCTTDEGLIARLKERLSGCWTKRQLHEVDDDARAALGVGVCRPLPAPLED